uniref:Homeobox domain-containing protein n=1 Tax=Meloidogyne javanica TaxID=6303 RepID=A0A915M1S9_MELJA
MSQIFNNDSQQKQQNDVDSFCAVQMAQIAQMMLSAQMTAAAQMASLNSENGRNGLLNLLGIKNEEETIITKEVDDNQELNKSVSPYEEPRAKKQKTELEINLLQHSKNEPEQELVMIMLRFYASEEQIKEMAQRTNLAEKVIKHWFRNTLFKERQRDKDSPYNFSIPPQMSIDLATYHKTGEAKIVPLIKQEVKNK